MMSPPNNHYQTLQCTDEPGVRYIAFSRASAKNSLNGLMVTELRAALANAEKDASVKVIVLVGNNQHFCSGMDFEEVGLAHGGQSASDAHNYYELLKEMSSGTKVVVSKVEGQVNAGGVGLVAACDIVISSATATFGLSEMLFGLLPACVLPFLIRRTGFQRARWMTMITQGISAQRAFEIGLVDEVSQDPSDVLRRYLLRLTRLETTTIGSLKTYMSKLWIIDERTEELAVDQLNSLMQSAHVQSNIKRFVTTGLFPWSSM